MTKFRQKYYYTAGLAILVALVAAGSAISKGEASAVTLLALTLAVLAALIAWSDRRTQNGFKRRARDHGIIRRESAVQLAEIRKSTSTALTEHGSQVRDSVDSTVSSLRAEVRGLRVSHQLQVQAISRIGSAVERSQADISELLHRVESLASVMADRDASRETAPEPGLFRFQTTPDVLQSVDAPGAMVPGLAGSEASPKSLLATIRAARALASPLVVECGASSSTAWLGLALRAHGGGRVVTLEHRTDRVDGVRGLLRDQQLDALVDVVHVPLREVRTARGAFHWYDIPAEAISGDVDVVLIHGPTHPYAVAPLYPALAELKSHLSTGTVIIVNHADDEQVRQTLELWLAEDPRLERDTSGDLEVAVLRVGGLDVAEEVKRA